MRVRIEPTMVNHLTGSILFGRLIRLPINIRLDWLDLQPTNALAYYELS